MLSAPLSAPSPVIQQREVMTDRRLGSWAQHLSRQSIFAFWFP